MREQRKSTNKELVEELEKRNVNGRLDKIIANAKANRYHDYKNPDDVVCGKMQFLADTHSVQDLVGDLQQQIKDGVYDEEADETDKAEMRKDLPPSMWPMLGL